MAGNTVTRLSMPEFFNAWCLGAVVVFGLNNHVWKFQYHNWFTGKLSDLMACFFLPLFLSAILKIFVNWPLATRVSTGAVITAVIFTVVKTSAMASSILNSLLSAMTSPFGLGVSTNIADPTDLIALPMILLACYVAQTKVAIDEK